MFYQVVVKIKSSKTVWRKLGGIYQQVGNHAEAEMCYRKAA